MEDQKVLHTEDINWYEEKENRLDYELAFGDDGLKKRNQGEHEQAETNDPKVDVKQLIKKRDKKWEKRLEKARNEAFEQGFEEGKEEGYARAESEIDDKLFRLEKVVARAHHEWKEHYLTLDPGLLDLVFDITEKMVGLPVENSQIREQLEDELSVLLHQTDEEIKPQLRVSETDYVFVKELVEKYTPKLSLSILVSEECNPGEFEFETEKETVVHRFRKKLTDFRENLSLPSWE